jgi:RimJ/RimL family protein N-acetyltransferase
MGRTTKVPRVDLREHGLLLRPWQPRDAEPVYRACQDPEIQRWTTIPRPYLREHAEGFVNAYTEQSWVNGTAAPLGVFDAGTGELLGSNGLITLQSDYRTGEIGYWTAPWARGRGVATAATRAVARWCLDQLGLRRISWRAEVGNHASRLVATRIGFRVEGILRAGAPRRDGTRADCWGAALLPGDLREDAEPVDPVVRLRAATFGAAQPRLTALTPAGSKVALRPPETRDLDAIVAACRDAESVRWTTVPHPYDRRNAEYFIRERSRLSWIRGEAGVFAMADADDAYVGSMELRLSVSAPDTAEVGFLVAPWARGRGYAPAALRTLCAWGFDALGVNRITWTAYLGNDASKRVAEKTGFQLEGITRAGCVQRGEYRDAWTAALLATDPRPPA